MSTTRSSFVGLTILSLVALGACGSDDDDSSSATPAPAASTTAAPAAPAGSTPAATVSGSLDAADQTSDGSTITVSTVSITGSDGFIAVHADASGQPGPVVGHAAIPEGDSTDVVITLDAPVTSGAFWPMLHTDGGVLGTYEFPGPDGPVTDGADVVMKQINLTVG